MPPLSSIIHLYDSSAGIRKAKRTYIIYFITGNPGLVEYYRTFFDHLYGLLRPKYNWQDVDFQIYGQSLAGFEVNGSVDLLRENGKGPPYDVNQQIEISEQRLKNVVLTAKANGAKDVRVILMGHSLGTYMCLEIIRRLREESKVSGDAGVRVTGAVLLFATVMHLAKSPSGLKSSVCAHLVENLGYSSSDRYLVVDRPSQIPILCIAVR
jgi:pimeloyl-ACP methyl ester carboxylesterase